ncbi:MAG TPA: hypothetical protein VHI31_07395 [Actinomycetota bacterium]|nr:hypothetical protein [Actinomycetota bacterium]
MSDEQKGIETEAAVADDPEELGAGLDPDEVVGSLKGMREVPSEASRNIGEAGTGD